MTALLEYNFVLGVCSIRVFEQGFVYKCMDFKLFDNLNMSWYQGGQIVKRALYYDIFTSTSALEM